MARFLVAVSICLFGVRIACGSISEFKQLKIDFGDPADAREKATWSPDKILNIGANGLGWDGAATALHEGWIRTKPLAVGLSWRPPYAVSVRLAIRPALTEITLNDGTKMVPYSGTAYVRYSPDLKNWSTWQALESTDPQLPNEKGKPGRYFRGQVQVPQQVRGPYGEMLSHYSTVDVPWASDEDAAVHWILRREPDFFARQLPFIGYVEFLFEQTFYGSQRIDSLEASVMYGMSGMAAVPRDKAAHIGNEGPWRFKAEPDKPADSP